MFDAGNTLHKDPRISVMWSCLFNATHYQTLEDSLKPVTAYTLCNQSHWTVLRQQINVRNSNFSINFWIFILLPVKCIRLNLQHPKTLTSNKQFKNLAFWPNKNLNGRNWFFFPWTTEVFRTIYCSKCHLNKDWFIYLSLHGHRLELWSLSENTPGTNQSSCQ